MTPLSLVSAIFRAVIYLQSNTELFTPGIDQSSNIYARKLLQKIVTRIVIVTIDGKAAAADQNVARLKEERGDNQAQQLYSQ